MIMILASASPRRKELLKKVVRNFSVVISQVDENQIKAKDPASLAVLTALAKAKAVAGKVKSGVVIGADTIVILGPKILGKPRSKKDAYLMLKDLVGKTHLVITGLALINTDSGKIVTGCEKTRVNMKKVKDNEILDYVRSGKPLDKAGSYGIQEIEEAFIDKITGDYDNVVGLPLRRLKQLLKQVSS